MNDFIYVYCWHNVKQMLKIWFKYSPILNQSNQSNLSFFFFFFFFFFYAAEQAQSIFILASSAVILKDANNTFV